MRLHRVRICGGFFFMNLPMEDVKMVMGIIGTGIYIVYYNILTYNIIDVIYTVKP